MEALWQSLELLPDAAVIVDELGTLRWHNGLMAPWLPACAGAGLGLAAEQWLSPGSIPALRRVLSAAPAPREAELELELGGAAAGRWLAARWRLLPGCVAERHTWLLTLRECTGARAERLAQETERLRLSHAVSTRAIGIYEHDHQSDEIYASQALRVQYGLEAERRLTIADFASATHPHDGEFLLGEISKAHDPERDGSFDVVHRILIPSGETRWLHTRATTSFRQTADGQRLPAKTLGSCIEITHEHEN